MAKGKEIYRMVEILQKDRESRLGEVPTSQIWDYLSIKKNNDSDRNN
jgi:hypothetical protein